MKISTSKLYTFLLLLVLFLQLYLPSFKANIFIQIGVLLFLVITNNIGFTKSFLKEIAPLLILFSIGFIGSVVYENQLFQFFKDVFHFIKPLTGILVGYLLVRKINDFSTFIKSIIYLGIFSAIIHFIIILFYSNLGSVSGIREYGKDNYLELFSLMFLVFYKKFQGKKMFQNPFVHKVIVLVLLLSFMLYLSRTMIVLAVVILFSIYGYNKITINTIKIFSLLCVSVILLYTYLFSVKIDRNGKGIESFLYKIKIAPEEIFTPKIDKTNHQKLWDHWRAYEAIRAFALMEQKPGSLYIGTGYGSLVNLKFYAPLTGEKDGLKYISDLHNGYVYILYKTGIISLLIYLFFLFKLYSRAYLKPSFSKVFVSAFGIIYLFSTLTITGVYNARDIIIILLGGFLFFDSQKKVINE